MPVERRGLTLNMQSERGGVPLGQTSVYGTTGIVGTRRSMASSLCQTDTTAGETLILETEAIS